MGQRVYDLKVGSLPWVSCRQHLPCQEGIPSWNPGVRHGARCKDHASDLRVLQTAGDAGRQFVGLFHSQRTGGTTVSWVRPTFVTTFHSINTTSGSPTLSLELGTKWKCGSLRTKIKNFKLALAEHWTKCGACGDCTGGMSMKPALHHIAGQWYYHQGIDGRIRPTEAAQLGQGLLGSCKLRAVFKPGVVDPKDCSLRLQFWAA